MPDFVDMGTHDFLAKSTVLRRHGNNRVFFDPTNPDHIESMKHYMETGNWLQQFYPEDPFIEVPMTVFRKFAGMHLGVLVTTSQKLEARQRLQAMASQIPLSDEVPQDGA